jgi:hypothetical protein
MAVNNNHMRVSRLSFPEDIACPKLKWLGLFFAGGRSEVFDVWMVPEKGIEPPTFSLRMNRSTN